MARAKCESMAGDAQKVYKDEADAALDKGQSEGQSDQGRSSLRGRSNPPGAESWLSAEIIWSEDPSGLNRTGDNAALS